MNKIKEYVDYLFKLNKIDDLARKEELISNLESKFIDLKANGMAEDDAYIETIKGIGDLSVEEVVSDNQFRYKPSWANISLYISLALSVIGLIVLFISTPINIVLITLSIVLYIGASYYLYHMSQHVLKEEKDVVKHNELLKAIFTHLKTIFIFWNINISYWLANIIISVLISLSVFETVSVGTFEYLSQIVLFTTIIGILIFIILLLVGNGIYKKLELKYYELTLDDKLDNLISKNKDIIFNALSDRTKNILKTIIYIFSFVLLTMITIYTGPVIDYNYIHQGGGFIGQTHLGHFTTYYYDVVSDLIYVPFVILGLSFVGFVISLFKNNLFYKYISLMLLLVTKIVTTIIIFYIIQISENISFKYFNYFSIPFYILLVIWLFFTTKKLISKK